MAIDRIRGSVNLPLTIEGHTGVQQLANRIAAKGGLHQVHSSDMIRTQQTAMPIAAASGAHMSVTPKLRDMAMGLFEGQKSSDAIGEINNHIINKPSVPMPGRSPDSTTNGESFNAYKGRMLPVVQAAMADSAANPNKKTGLVVNRRSLKTVSAWLKAGGKPTLETDPKEATSFNEADLHPGSIHHIDTSTTPPSLNEVDTASNEPLKGGTYLIRHGITAWNKESSL